GEPPRRALRPLAEPDEPDEDDGPIVARGPSDVPSERLPLKKPSVRPALDSGACLAVDTPGFRADALIQKLDGMRDRVVADRKLAFEHPGQEPDLLGRRDLQRRTEPGVRQPVRLAGIARYVAVAVVEAADIVGEALRAEPLGHLLREPDDRV